MHRSVLRVILTVMLLLLPAWSVAQAGDALDDKLPPKISKAILDYDQGQVTDYGAMVKSMTARRAKIVKDLESALTQETKLGNTAGVTAITAKLADLRDDSWLDMTLSKARKDLPGATAAAASESDIMLSLQGKWRYYGGSTLWKHLSISAKGNRWFVTHHGIHKDPLGNEVKEPESTDQILLKKIDGQWIAIIFGTAFIVDDIVSNTRVQLLDKNCRLERDVPAK